jgi:translation initiation factor 3 subunit J
VLESWDAAEDSDAEREKAKKEAEAKAKAAAAAKASHKSRTQRIEQHKEDNRRRQEAEEEESSEEEDEAERRARLRKEQKVADLRHAEDLFGDLSLGGGSSSRSATRPVNVADPADPAGNVDLSKLPVFNPDTKDQFAKLRETLVPLLVANTKKAHYVLFMQEFAKQLCKDLPSDQIKKIASILTTLSNEKMKEEKAAEKTGKKSKAAKTKAVLNANRDITRKADTNAYDDGLEEYVSLPSSTRSPSNFDAGMISCERCCLVRYSFFIICHFLLECPELE